MAKFTVLPTSSRVWLKAIALGARFVFVGRPFTYAAAIGGEAGVQKRSSCWVETTLRRIGCKLPEGS